MPRGVRRHGRLTVPAGMKLPDPVFLMPTNSTNTIPALRCLPSFKNPDRISVAMLASIHGHDDIDEFIETECNDSVVMACCRHGCEVEPDGRCEHGCPSPLLALGII